MYVCVFVVLRLSCSVDRHVSGCQYLTGVMYVYYAESAKSCSHDSVEVVGVKISRCVVRTKMRVQRYHNCVMSTQ